MSDRLSAPTILLQFSDTHLFANTNATLRDVNCYQSLQSVYQHASQHYPNADLAVISGDLTQSAQIPAYQHFIQLSSQLPCPYYVLPGNHDDPSIMQTLFCALDKQTIPPYTASVAIANWKILLLNSHCKNQTSGKLAEQDLHWIKQTLHSHPDVSYILFIHHQAIKMTKKFDAMMLDNGEQLLSLLAHYPQCKAVCWGHVHQAYQVSWQHLQLLACPSTNIQFEHYRFLQVDKKAGYRVIYLYPDGSLTTHIERVSIPSI